MDLDLAVDDLIRCIAETIELLENRLLRGRMLLRFERNIGVVER
jgi:hypothetical protein